MATWEPPEGVYLAVELLTADNESIELQELSSFLFDLNLAHDIARLGADPEYSEFKFTTFVGNRKGRWQLRKEDRLHVTSIHFGSPLELVGIVAHSPGAVYGLMGVAVAAAAAWHVTPRVMREVGGLFKAFADGKKKLADARKTNAQARLLEAKAEKAELEVRERKEELERHGWKDSEIRALPPNGGLIEVPINDKRLIAALRKRGALRAFARVVERLRQSRVEPVALNIRLIDGLPKPAEGRRHL